MKYLFKNNIIAKILVLVCVLVTFLMLVGCNNTTDKNELKGNFQTGFYTTANNTITTDIIKSTDNSEINVMYDRSGNISLLDNQDNTINGKKYKEYKFSFKEDGDYKLTFIDSTDISNFKNTILYIKVENQKIVEVNNKYEEDKS